MVREYEQYISEVKALQLPEYFDEQKREAAEILGDWVTAKPSGWESESARKYLTSRKKKNIGKTFGIISRRMATPVANMLAEKIQKIDKPDPGILVLSVGFSENGKKRSLRKLRSLKSGTSEKMESGSPFLGPTYQSGTEYLKELRIHHPLSWILRTGFDEMLQLGDLALVGPRGYLPFELRSIKILKALCGIKELGFSSEMQKIIRNHEGIMVTQGVVPGIINPMSAITEDGGHPTALPRLLLDEQYALFANPFIDIQIGTLSVVRRSRQLVSVIHAVSSHEIAKTLQGNVFKSGA